MFWKLIYLTLIPLHNRGRWSVNVLNFFLMALIATSIICSGSNWNGWRMVEWKFSLSHVFSSEQSLSQRAIHDITSIRRRPNFDEFLRHFHVLFRRNFDGRKIHVVSTFFFRRNFNGRKIHVLSTYLFQCNFNGRKIHVVSTYFFWRNFDGRKIYVVSTDFFRCNFSSRNIHGVSTYIFWRNFDAQKIQFVCKYFFLRNFNGQKFDVIFGNL